MTTSDTSNQFRITLLRVANLLTRENVQNLAFLCKEISPARREKLTNGVELFAALQGHDLLSEVKVNVLAEWLDELSLLEASKLLKEYSDNYLNVDPVLKQKCLIHENLPLKYFCVSCDTKICPDCAYTSHNQNSGCDVISVEKLRDEIAARQARLVVDLESAKTVAESSEQLWGQKRDFLAKCRNSTREQVLKDYLATLEIAEKKKRDALDKLNDDEVSDMRQLMSEKKQLQSLRNDVDLLSEGSLGPSDRNLQELKRISKAMKEVGEIKGNIEHLTGSMRKGTAGIVYREGNGKGGFEIVTVFIGSMSLGFQLVNIIDDRHIGGGVILVCLDSSNPSKTFWRHKVIVDDHRSPVVMSHIDMWHGGENYILFAAGKTVFAVLPHSTGSLCDYVQSDTPIPVNEIPEGSWITSISALNLSGYPSELFLISIHGTSTIREYDLSGRNTRSISLNEHFPSNGITCIAYYNNSFAVISHACSEVMLLTYSPKGAVKGSGSLRPPSAKLKPVLVISTGVNWLVLHIQEGAESQWVVAHYDKTGEIMKVCANGASSGQASPVSISRWRSNGFVTFADKSIKAFKY